MDSRKINMAIRFLKYAPEALLLTSEDETYQEEASILEAAADYCQKASDPTDAAANILSHHGKDALLFRLTCAAESADPEEAAEASYQLGKLYLGKGRPKNVSTPVCPEIALGYLSRAIRLGNRKAKREYADLAESCGLFHGAAKNIPDHPYEAPVRKMFNEHRVRMAREMGGELRPLDDQGLVPEKANSKADALITQLQTCMDRLRKHCTSVKSKADALESHIPDKLETYYNSLFDLAEKGADTKKRRRRNRRRIAWLIILLMVIGAFMGPEKGLRGILYLFFLIPSTFLVLQNHDIGSIGEFLSFVATEDERATWVGTMIPVILIANLVNNILIFMFSSKIEDAFVSKKAEFVRKCGMEKILEEAKALTTKPVILTDAELQQLQDLGIHTFGNNLDELAMQYHTYRFCEKPKQTYGQLARTTASWSYTYNVPKWFYRAYPDMDQVSSVDLETNAVRYAQEWLDKCSDHKVSSRYEASVALEFLLADRNRALTIYPWRVRDMWEAFVEPEYEYLDTWAKLMKNYYLLLADQTYGPAEAKKDGQALYLHAAALFPSMTGRRLADRALEESGEPAAGGLWERYDRYYHPAKYYKPDPSPSSYKDTSGDFVHYGISGGDSGSSGWWPETKTTTRVNVYDNEGYNVAKGLSMEEAYSAGYISADEMLDHLNKHGSWD